MGSSNEERLSGDRAETYQPASQIPPDSKAGTLTFRAAPGRDDVVMYPYGGNYQNAPSVVDKRARCGVNVDGGPWGVIV